MKGHTNFLRLYGGQTLITALLALSASSVQAQFWNGSGIQTYTTSSNVGIGIGPVTDARLKVQNVFSNGPGTMPLDAVPGVIIQRNLYLPLINGPAANVMEVWKQNHGSYPFGGATGPNERLFVIDGDGQVGINKQPTKALDVADDANIDNILTVGAVAGASSPDVMTVSGNITFTRPSDNQVRNIRARTSAGSLIFFANTAGENGPSISLNGITNTSSGTAGALAFSSVGTGTAAAFDFNNYDPSASAWNTRMRVTANGKVLIGSPSMATPTGYKLYVADGIQTEGKVAIGPASMPTPAGYRLYVDDGILTKRLKIALPSDPTNWSDFVFADDYELRSLNEVESYIAKHKHLPEIPSTAEVHKDGLDVAQMNAKLLQKIEELTLYMIQQQKEIDALKKKVRR